MKKVVALIIFSVILTASAYCEDSYIPPSSLMVPSGTDAVTPIGGKNIIVGTEPTNCPNDDTTTCIERLQVGTVLFDANTIPAQSEILGSVIYEDNFSSDANWSLSGSSCTWSVSGNVGTLDDSNAAGVCTLELSLTGLRTPPAEPYIIEFVGEFSSTTLLNNIILSGSGGSIFTSILNWNGSSVVANTLNTSSQSTAAVNDAPADLDLADPFRLLMLIDPTVLECRLYLYYINTTPDMQYHLVSSATTFSYQASNIPNVLRMITGSSGTGTFTIENFYIYTPFAVLVGDSIAQGHPRWASLMGYANTTAQQTDIGLWLERGLGEDVKVVNQGDGGHAIADLLSRYDDDILPFKTPYVFLNIGTNDAYAGTTMATAQTNLETIVDGIIANGSVVILNDIAPRNNFDATMNTWKDSWNTWLVTFADGKAGCYLSQSHDSLEDPVTPDDLRTIYDSGDGVHLIAGGQRIVATEMLKTMVGR